MTTESLNVYISSSLSQQKRRYTQDSLYELYDDYFNVEDQATPLEPSPINQGHLHPHYVPSSQPTPFFFVLSSSSPISPNSGSGFTPTSPLPTEDIPDVLHQIIPQPSNSLFKVIDVIQNPNTGADADSSSFGERGRSEVRATETPTPSNRPFPIINPPSRSSSTSRVRPTPPPLEIRDTITPIKVSTSYHKPLNPPNSSTVEIGLSMFTPSRKPDTALPNPQSSKFIYTPSNSSTPTVTRATVTEASQQQPPQQFRRRPLPPNPHDPQTRVTYPSTNSQPVNRAHIRVNDPQSLIDTSTTANQNPVIAQDKGRSIVGQHVRGRSSPFPTGGIIPIQLYFAPPSIPGSARTSYSYF